MDEDLTFEAVELQQCARSRNSKSPPPASFGSPLATKQRHGSPRIILQRFISMASSTDSAFVDDVDVDEQLLARGNGLGNTHSDAPRHRPNKSGAIAMTDADSDNEDVPLLRPTRNDYGSADGEGHSNSDEGWPTEADFRGLPWWKRPSVSTFHERSICQITDEVRSIGSSRRFCCSP